MNTVLLEKEGRRKGESNYIQYIDVLRVLSMLSVVFLHTTAGSLRVNLGSTLWHFSNILTSIMSTSVPTFFMLSGAMLLSNNKTESIPYTYKKRLPKAFIPFLAWSIIAVVYYGFIGMQQEGNFVDAKSRLFKIMSTPTTVHLWFMYALIPLYLISPILKKLVDNMSDTLFRYCLILWFTFSSVLPTLAAVAPSPLRQFFVLSKEYSLNFLNGYIGYFLLGYYLLNYKKNISVKLLAGIIFVDTVIISAGTWYKTMAMNEYSEIFKVYSRLFVLILSVAIFLLVKELVLKNPIKNVWLSIVKFLSALSFGVYLMHNLLIDALARITAIIPAYSVRCTILVYLVVLLISFLSIVIFSSIKFTSFVFTGVSYKSACKSCNLQFIIRTLKREN